MIRIHDFIYDNKDDRVGPTLIKKLKVFVGRVCLINYNDEYDLYIISQMGVTNLGFWVNEGDAEEDKFMCFSLVKSVDIATPKDEIFFKLEYDLD